MATETKAVTTTLDDNGVPTSVFGEMANFRSKIDKDKLREMERPEGLWVCARKTVQDWAIIILGHQIFVHHPDITTALLAMVFMAWGQRGLACIGHDSIHGNLVRNRFLNDLLADLFLAPPLLSTAKTQRAQHNAHHNYLGTKKDPDHGEGNEMSLKHYRTGKKDLKNIFPLFLYDVFDWPHWSKEVVASLPDAPLQLLTWWTVVYTLSFFLLEPSQRFMVGPVPVNSFFLLFHLTRCTLTHGVYVFREIIDHGGLHPSGGVLHFSRTSPYGGMLQRFIQPHDDNYHLLHHILPRIPMSKYNSSHQWLLENSEEYKKANR
ncbi:hypothetical protein EG329_011315 [Mollisiaceae sp. DMI_Dod_QoI]|nr:hypothetical protein EG329_011315 [Helotiales sp. DMI_Dod_QoI]